MRYLGRVSGSGTLGRPGEEAVQAKFEFECYLVKSQLLTSSGEIVADPAALRRMFGVNDVAFVTDEGHQLKLTLADKKVAPNGDTAYVVATGELPVFNGGVLHWPPVERPAPETL